LPLHEAKKLVKALCNQLVKKGHTQAARQTMSFAASFWNFHNADIPGKGEMRFKRGERPVAVSKKIVFEVIPHNADIYKLADVALGYSYRDSLKNKLLGLRNRAIILFLWQSGIRVNALCRLKHRHVKPYVEGRITWEFLRQECKECNVEYWQSMGLKLSELPPLFLKVTPQIDTKIGAYGLSYYVTFLHHEGFRALKDWLKLRTEIYGPLRDEDYLFVRYDFKNNRLSDRPLDQNLINHMIKVVTGRAGMYGHRLWTHVLRKSFRKVLRGGMVDEETAEALMGHKLPRSQGNYFDCHDIVEIARKYMACDWTRGQISRLNGLQRQVEEQAKTIEQLPRELKFYKSQAELFQRQRQQNQEEIKELKKMVKQLSQRLSELQAATTEVLKAKKFLGWLGEGEEE